jgi:type I restriction enzyme S subunit
MTAQLPPYPEYKDSGVPWLGEVPAHWQQLPGRACYREKKISNTGMKEMTVLSLSYGQIVVKPEAKLHGLVPASFETYQIVDPGDIIVRPTDLQNDWNSLRFGLSHHRGIITSAYMCLHTQDAMMREYGHLLLHAYDLKKVFYGLGSGLRQNLDWRDFKYLPCLVPPPAEQAAIVRYLDHMERRIRRYIRAKRRLLALLAEQKQAIINQAVTRGLDADAPRKPSGVAWLGEVPAHWEVWQIGHFAEVGNGSTPSRSNAAYWNDGSFPWLNSSSVNQGRILASDQFVTALALKECHLPVVQPGSILVAITGQGKTRGTAALLDVEATINQHMVFITPKMQRISPSYLQMFLIAAYAEFRRISDDAGGTKGALTCEDVRHFKVLIPPIDEQRLLVDFLKEKSQSIELVMHRTQREIDLLREYRTRLIADVVTGQVDVRAAAAALPVDMEDVDEFAEDAVLAEEDEIVEDGEAQ